MKKFRANAERVCQALLPGRPIYALLGSEVPENLRPRGALAITGRGLDLVFRSAIGDRWQGRGAVILLNDPEIMDYAFAAYRAGPQRIHAQQEGWKATGHEIAHLVLREISPSETDENPDPVLISAFSAGLAEFCVTAPLAIAQPTPWIGHDGVFIRTLSHVAHRVRQATGDWLPYNGWFNPHQYGLRGAEHEYASTLGDEPERLADVPLTEIANISPPKEFAKLWRRDVRTWFASIENPSDEQAAALVRGLRMFPCFSRKENTMSVLEKINDSFSTLRQQQADSYAGLVRSLLDDEKIDAGRAAKILDQSDRTPEQLASDVELLRHRRELRSTIDALPGLEKEQKTIARKIDSANRDLEEADNRHTEIITPLGDRLQAIAEARQTARQAEVELRQTAAPELAAEIAEINSELTMVGAELARVESEAEYLRGQRKADLESRLGGPISVETSEKLLVENREQVEKLTAEADALKAKQVSLQARREKLEAAQLKI